MIITPSLREAAGEVIIAARACVKIAFTFGGRVTPVIPRSSPSLTEASHARYSPARSTGLVFGLGRLLRIGRFYDRSLLYHSGSGHDP